MEVRRELMPVIKRRQEKGDRPSSHEMMDEGKEIVNMLDVIVDIREYDVPYTVRVCIDKEIRAGQFYNVTTTSDSNITLQPKTLQVKPNPKVLAFDIECTKAPLKFPSAEVDEIFMISYMIDGQGYLIISREVVSEDIDDFEVREF